MRRRDCWGTFRLTDMEAGCDGCSNTINGRELIRVQHPPFPARDQPPILHDWVYLLNLVCDTLQTLDVTTSFPAFRLHF